MKKLPLRFLNKKPGWYRSFWTGKPYWHFGSDEDALTLPTTNPDGSSLRNPFIERYLKDNNLTTERKDETNNE